jgi:hypothetical protein
MLFDMVHSSNIMASPYTPLREQLNIRYKVDIQKEKQSKTARKMEEVLNKIK